MKNYSLLLITIFLILINCKKEEDSVQESVLTTISVTAPFSSTYFGVFNNSFQLTARSFDQHGNPFVNDTYIWSSSNDDIATVDDNGNVLLLSTGDVIFTAEANNISGNVSISILETFQAGTTVFTNVNVVDVMNGLIINNKDVTIVNDKIESVTNAGSIAIPHGANVINGTGKYLMPGLSDAHVHVSFETDFYQYLANSVTSVIDMGKLNATTPSQSPRLVWKYGIINGTVEGPNYYPSALARNIGSNQNLIVSNAQQANNYVDLWHEFDFIKSYSFVPEDAFNALLNRTQLYNMNVIGHANRNIGMTQVLSRGQKMIAHAEEYLYTHFVNQNQAEIDDAITKTLNSSAFVTASLATYEAISKVWGLNNVGYDELKARPGYRYTHPAYKNSWNNQFNNAYNQPGSIDAQLAFQLVFIKNFHDAGVPLLLGTDSPGIIGLPGGFSLHEEMRLLSQAGISNADILKIGTANFGIFMKTYSRNQENFGQVSNGFRADLVLLENNPISDLSTLRTPIVVLVRGKVYTQTYLNQKLEPLIN